MALGASADMLPEIVGEGLRLAGIGVVIGVAAALAPTRLMSSALFGVSPNDPATFAGVATLLMGAAVAAASFRHGAQYAWTQCLLSATNDSHKARCHRCRNH